MDSFICFFFFILNKKSYTSFCFVGLDNNPLFYWELRRYFLRQELCLVDRSLTLGFLESSWENRQIYKKLLLHSVNKTLKEVCNSGTQGCNGFPNLCFRRCGMRELFVWAANVRTPILISRKTLLSPNTIICYC